MPLGKVMSDHVTAKDFWYNSTVAVIGGGSWGTVLAHLVSSNCRAVRFWLRDEEQVRQFNSTRVQGRYIPGFQLNQKVIATSSLASAFEGGVQAVIWCLPSAVCRSLAKEVAPFLRGDELILHATKGIESESLKRISEILVEELYIRRVGVISGPNLAHEIALGQPAATVIASRFTEVCEAGALLLRGPQFRIFAEKDIVGVEWAGTLKNILAIAAGALDGLKLGANSKAMLLTLGLSEMMRFGTALGAQVNTFLGLAGMGDLLATCGSAMSRNYRVGLRLAEGEALPAILESLGSTAEGVITTQTVWKFASSRGIPMPITEGVYRLTHEGVLARDILNELMKRE
jgi:glycerol-3-phosphate dehydrogenase (NAD(P)+)